MMIAANATSRFSDITINMALTVAEVDALVHDLSGHYDQLTHEYAVTADEERREELSNLMCSIDYQMARLEERRQSLLTNTRALTAGSGSVFH